MDEGQALVVEHAEVADELLEAGPEPDRGDHGVGSDPASVREHHIVGVERRHGRHDTYRTGPDCSDDADVENRDRPGANELREPSRGGGNP